MLIVQKFFTSGRTPRTYATTKTGHKEIGLTHGEQVSIYSNGETLFYSHDKELPRKAGYKYMMDRKVSRTQNRIQVSLPPLWVEKYCRGCSMVKVYYTDIGLFIKPYKED